MPIPSLYEICVHRTCVLLTAGTWEQCSTSPFVQIPAVPVNDVMSHLPTVLPPEDTRVSHLQPLMVSGWLQHLNMLHCRLEGWSICRVLDALLEGGRNLQTLVLPAFELRDNPPEDLALASGKLEALLRICPHLSDLHTPLLFDLRVLEHLPRLLCLNLHLPYQALMELFEDPDLGLMGCLKHLRMLTACGKLIRHPARIIVEQLLRHCPQLTSVGQLDSAIALERLEKTRDSREPLQLRKCVWEPDQYEDPAYLSLSPTYRLWFPRAIEASVLLCPLLQELRIKVLQRGGISHLARLGHLTSFDIDVTDCHSDCRYNVYRLLDEIGGQLKRIAVRGPFDSPMDVGGLCGRCPGLEYLRLLCAMDVTGPALLTGRFPRLRSLSLYRGPRAVLLFLLGNCPHLRELTLDFSDDLDDDLLMTVLKHNPLSELEDTSVLGCLVTGEGLAQFLESARALRRFDFVSAPVHSEMAKSMVEATNPRIAFRRRSLMSMVSPTEYFDTKNHLCRP